MHEYPHRIRLRGPWESEPVARLVRKEDGGLARSTDDLPPPQRMTMPCHWRDAGLEDFAGIVRLRRRFGYPGRIDEYERVWLTFAQISGNATITLNSRQLGQISDGDTPCEFSVTKLLQPRNELVVDVESLTDAGGLPGEVALEIRRTAFLQNMHARQIAGENPRIRVAGEIVGTSERPLDVYVLVGRRTEGYARIRLENERTPFEIISDAVEEAADLSDFVRIELVDGGVVWYGVEVSLHE